MKEKNLFTKEIANKIKQLLDEKNLSQRVLADKSGIKEGYLGYLLRGEKRFNLIHIEKICAALEYPVAKLFEDSVNSHEEQATSEYETPLEWALLAMFRELSPKDKGDILGKIEELKIKELREKAKVA